MKNSSRQRIEVNVDQLDRVLDEARQAPLSEEDYQLLKTTLHAMADRLRPGQRSEKMSELFGEQKPSPSESSEAQSAEQKPDKPAGHGRNGAEAFSGARQVKIAHQKLNHGDRCPECGRGHVYEQKEPKVLVRIVGQAPVAATVYSLERLRCNACGQIFTAQAPEGVGEEKYDATAAAMIAQMKYGSGVPFHRLERLEQHLGIPLPAATQWEIAKGAAEKARPAHEELIRQAAQGEVLHNDDTSMRVLHLARAPDDERTGVFTSGVVSIAEGRRIALFFTGRQHAGENIADVLRQRSAELPAPVQMCDASSSNTSAYPEGVKILLANCLAHGRRQFVEVMANFPTECRLVLEKLGSVYHNDALARRGQLSADERLRFHQEHSRPVMEALEAWMKAQLDEHLTEPNSGLGQAIQYMLRHWHALTLFLRQPNAPLDNTLVERALKKAILHRKNALYFKTVNGAQVGDLFMSLIHTCELNGVASLGYLIALQKHAREVDEHPAEWMPWNYRDTLARTAAV
jgi:transposase